MGAKTKQSRHKAWFEHHISHIRSLLNRLQNRPSGNTIGCRTEAIVRCMDCGTCGMAAEIHADTAEDRPAHDITVRISSLRAQCNARSGVGCADSSSEIGSYLRLSGRICRIRWAGIVAAARAAPVASGPLSTCMAPARSQVIAQNTEAVTCRQAVGCMTAFDYEADASECRPC